LFGNFEDLDSVEHSHAAEPTTERRVRAL
jgi:hypothetical protein